MKLQIALPFIILGFLAGFSGQLTAAIPDDSFLPGRILVKLEPEGGAHFNRYDGSEAAQSAGIFIADTEAMHRLETFLDAYDLQSITPVFGSQAFSKIQKLQQTRSIISEEAIHLAGALQRTFTVTYGSGEDPRHLAAAIRQLDGVVYAEPHYTHQTADTGNSYIPNDPYIGHPNHDYFEYMNIFRAWGVNRGSPDVVIAIIDTGVFYDHPDLKDNLWRNPEPGRADEYFPEFEISNDTIGWNFWDSGNIYIGESPVQNADPSGNYSTHGTMVAGIAAAVTDNAKGIAGVGFRSQFMPVKTGGTREYPNRIAFGYHGILYAAINGADVINCSFISRGRSNFGSDVIRFAQEMGSIVIGAIGNDGISTRGTFPASYEDVLSVGAVSNNFDDRLTGFSNYGPTLDVLAVGQSMLSTSFVFEESDGWWTPEYRVASGTSFSTPIVSGLAALLMAEYPDWPPQQIASQIRGTARSVSDANPGSQYENQLGQGVIDAYTAMSADDIPLISITGHTFSNDRNQKISVGETGTLTISGVHFGNTSPDIFFELESLQPGLTIHSAQNSQSELGPGENFNIDFSLSIDENYPLDVIPSVRLTWTIEDVEDRSYEGVKVVEYEELLYGNMDLNWLKLSISSDGTIGFMHPEDKTVGQGFVPHGFENILSEAGFMISGYRNGEPVVINQVRDSTGISRHFQPVENFRVANHPDIRNVQLGRAEFHSSNHAVAKELEMKIEAVAMSASVVNRSVILKYHITNNSEYLYEDLHFGLFNSWNFLESGNHQTFFSNDENLMYVRHESSPVHAGVAVMGEVTGALAIDNHSEMTLDRAASHSDSLSFGIEYDRESVNMDGFTDAEKRLALTSGTERTSLSAEDISIVIGTGPYTLYPHSSVTIGFVYGWELNPVRLRDQINAAFNQEFLDHDSPGGYSRTGKVADELTLHANFPNPFNARTTLRFDLVEAQQVELAVYDLVGRRVSTLVSGHRDEGPHFVEFNAEGLASGIYVAILKAGNESRSDMMMLVK